MIFFFWVNLVSSHLTKGFISYRSLMVGFLGLLMYTIISSANNETLTSSFPICIPVISLSCPVVLTRTSSTILNKYGESGQHCLVPDVCGIAVLLILCIVLFVDFSPQFIFCCLLLFPFNLTINSQCLNQASIKEFSLLLSFPTLVFSQF